MTSPAIDSAAFIAPHSRSDARTAHQTIATRTAPNPSAARSAMAPCDHQNHMMQTTLNGIYTCRDPTETPCLRPRAGVLRPRLLEAAAEEEVEQRPRHKSVGDQRVQSIHQSTMTGQKLAHVLHA